MCADGRLNIVLHLKETTTNIIKNDKIIFTTTTNILFFFRVLPSSPSPLED